MPKYSFSTLGCPAWTLEQIAQNAKNYGYDGVELRIDDEKQLSTSFNHSERNNCKTLFKEQNIEICVLSGYTTFFENEKENGEKLIENVQLAYDLGVPYVRTFIGKPGITGYGKEVLKQSCDLAASYGITILAEIHDSIPTGRIAKKLYDEIDSHGFGLIWDIYYTLMNNESPSQTIEIAYDAIRHVQLKDADRNGFAKLTGEGLFPIYEVVDQCLQKQYNGYFSFEWEKKWNPELADPEIVFPHFLNYMKKYNTKG